MASRDSNTVDRALIAFPISSPDPANRGLVMAWTEGGNLDTIMRNGMKDPPHYGSVGLMVWEGQVYIDPDPMPEKAKPRDGVWFEGIWRKPTVEEWALIKQGTHPWEIQAVKGT